MLLIALNGIRGSGKNTAANFIRKWGENRNLIVEERAFATLVKVAAMRSLGIEAATNWHDAVVIADEMKESGFVNYEIPTLSYARGITGREYLKWFATEGHRDVFGELFWVLELLPIGYDWETNFVNGEDDVADIGLITDLRFANEARRVKECGGFIWNIDRGFSPDEDGHLSEQPLPRDLVDKVIENKSTLEALEVAVNSEMTIEFHMKFVPQPDPDWSEREDSPFELEDNCDADD